MRSSPTTHYGTQRSLDFKYLIDPTSHELLTITPFINLHNNSTLSSTDPTSNPNHSTILVQISYSSDATIVAVAQASLRTIGGQFTAEITHVVVHTSHRQGGYGQLVLKHILTVATKQGACTAIAQPNTNQNNARITSKLFKRAGFQSSNSFGFVRYLRPSSLLSKSIETSPTRRNKPKPTNMNNNNNNSNESKSKNDRESPSHYITNKEPWKEISIEYWCHGGVRKVATVGIPTFSIGSSILSSSGRGSNRNLCKNVPLELSKHLCSLKRLDPDQRVSLSMSELLGYKLAMQWWLDLQQNENENDVLLSQERKSSTINTAAEREIQSWPYQHPLTSERSKQSDSSNQTYQTEVAQLKQQLRSKELALVQARKELQQRSTQSQQQQPSQQQQQQQQQPQPSQQQKTSPGDLSFPISGERIHNRGPPVFSGRVDEQHQKTNTANTTNTQTIAARVKKKVENSSDVDNARIRPGGIRLDFMDTSNGNNGKVETKKFSSPPMRGFMTKSAYTRPIARKVNKSESKSPESARKLNKIKSPSTSPKFMKSNISYDDVINEEEDTSFVSELSEEQLELARSRVAQMLLLEEEILNEEERMELKRKNDRVKLKAVFEHTDKDSTGTINVREMLLGLRKDPELARLLHLPSHIKQEGGTREAFERVFQAMDDHMDRHITYNELESYIMNHSDDGEGLPLNTTVATTAATATTATNDIPTSNLNTAETTTAVTTTDVTTDTPTTKPNTTAIISSNNSVIKVPASKGDKHRRKSLLFDYSNMDENTIIPSAPLSGIVREGWLMKMGRGKKTWKRRWFVLVAYDSGGCSLLYFTAPISGVSGDGSRKGAIHMTSAVAIDEVYDLKDSKHSSNQRYNHEQQFSICVKDRELVLSCESQEERSQWIVDFNRCLASSTNGAPVVCEAPTGTTGRRGSTFVKPFTKRKDGMRNSMVKYDEDENDDKDDKDDTDSEEVFLKGNLEKKSTSMIARWQSRYFIKTNTYLKYYQNEKSYQARQKDGPLGTINLKSVVIVDHVLDLTGVTGGVFCITLHGGDRKQITLRAKNEVESEQWVKNLNDGRTMQPLLKDEQEEK